MSLKPATFEFSDGYNLLMLQAEQGNIEEVRKLVASRKNLDINQVNKKGSTALALGIKSGSLAVTKELVAGGADVNIKNHSGQSPLLLACWLGFEDIARFLIENGADINSTDQRGWTPLMMATYYNFTSIVYLLMQSNADPAVQDSYGKTALDRAKDPEIFRIIKEKLPQSSSPQRSREYASPKQQLSTIHSPPTQKSRAFSGGLREKMWGFNSPQSEEHQSFDYRSPQTAGSTIVSDRRRSRSQSKERSFSASKSMTNALKSVSQNQPPESEIPLSMKQKFLKDELEKMISDQISYFKQKMQNIIVQKVSYEVPIQVHKQRKKVKTEAEDSINMRLASIIASLNTYFNLKLKFCLNKAGFDPSTLDLRPFLDSEEVRRLEVAPIVREHDLESDDFKKIEALRTQLDEIEHEAFSRRAQTLDQSWSHPPREERADGLKSFGNRWQIKNELLEHMNSEFKSSSDYLTNYSNDKISNLIREENQVLSRKIFSELGNVVEKLEDQIRHSFEESITKRVNQITETLTSHPKHSSPFGKKASTGSLLTPGAKDFVGTYGLSSSRQKLINELENYGGDDGYRESKTYGGGAASLSRSWQQDELNNSRRFQETRSKIQNIKDSLDTDFEASPPKYAEDQSYKGTVRGTGTNFLSPVANPSPSAKLNQGFSRRQERESPIRSNLGSGDKYSVNELVNLMRSQKKERGSSRKGSDSRRGIAGQYYTGSEPNRSYGLGRRDESF